MAWRRSYGSCTHRTNQLDVNEQLLDITRESLIPRQQNDAEQCRESPEYPVFVFYCTAHAERFERFQ